LYDFLFHDRILSAKKLEESLLNGVQQGRRRVTPPEYKKYREKLSRSLNGSLCQFVVLFGF
jgi:hypothetical protein